MDTVQIKEGLRIAKACAKRRKQGWKRHDGTVRQICDAVLRECWNGRFYQASAGHFCQFYCRDLGIACESLVPENVVASLSYALQRFREAGAVKVAITPDGRPFDFPTFSPDSLAFLLKALRVARAEQVTAAHQDFLEAQIRQWCAIVIDPDGFVRKGVHFGGMRDHAKRSSSAYDNAMVLLLKHEARRLGLQTPDITLTSKEFVDEFWVDDHFKDERDKDEVSGDASVVPFWLGVVDDARKARMALHKLHRLRMDRPVPLAYSATTRQAPKMIWQNVFVPKWEVDARWLQVGLMYTALAKEHDKKLYEEMAESLRDVILKNGNVLEVFTPEGKPYQSRLYHADEGMLWGAALAKKVL